MPSPESEYLNLIEQHLKDIQVTLTNMLSVLNSMNGYLRALYDNIPHK